MAELEAKMREAEHAREAERKAREAERQAQTFYRLRRSLQRKGGAPSIRPTRSKSGAIGSTSSRVRQSSGIP